MHKVFSRATAEGRQNLIIFLCWCVYSSAYFGRYSFSSSINSIIGNYNIDKAQTGLVMTFFFVAYGVGQVVNGFLCKHYPSRYIFPVALWGSSLINLILFAGIKTGYIAEYFYLVKYIWLANGIVQSLLWTSLIFVLGKNVEKHNIPKSGVVIGITAPLGTFIAYSTTSLLEHFGIYEISFVLAAVIMSFVGVMWVSLYTPNERTDIEPKSENTDKNGGKRTLSHAAIITIFCLSIFAVSNNFIKDGLQTWIPTILKETYRFSNDASLILATSIYMLGTLGIFIVKRINKYIKDYALLSVLFFAFMSVFTVIIRVSLNVSALPVAISFGLVMLGGYGVNNIVTSLAPLSLRDEINPGVVAGILDGFCYAGSALATYTLGLVADKYSWNVVITLLLITAVSATVISAVLKLITKSK